MRSGVGELDPPVGVVDLACGFGRSLDRHDPPPTSGPRQRMARTNRGGMPPGGFLNAVWPAPCTAAAPGASAGSSQLVQACTGSRARAADRRPATPVVRDVLDLDVGIDAVVLDHPVAAFESHMPKSGIVTAPPSTSGRLCADADEPAPRALADDRTRAPSGGSSTGTQSPPEPAYSFTRMHFGPSIAVDGVRKLVAVAGRPVRPRRALQPLDEEVGDEPAAVEALVDDDPVLVDLRVVLLRELLDARDRGVRHVDVGDAARRSPSPPSRDSSSTQSRVAQRGLVRDRRHDVGARLRVGRATFATVIAVCLPAVPTNAA